MSILFLTLQEPVKKTSSKKKTDAKRSGRKKSKKSAKKKVAKDTTAVVKPSADTASTVKATSPLPAETAVPAPVKPITYDLFSGHELRPKQITPHIRKLTHQDWFPLVTLFIVFLFSLINVFYHKKFRTFLISLTKRTTGQVTREDNVFSQRLRILLFCLFALITSAFFYQAGVQYGVKPGKLTSFQYFSVILFIIFFAYLLKLLAVRILGYIFKTEKETHDYGNNILLFLNILSFGLFPLVILIGFTPGIDDKALIKGGCVFISAAILFRIGRGYLMAVSNPLLSRFYLFLYLCTLEILPLVVIFKLFVDQFL